MVSTHAVVGQSVTRGEGPDKVSGNAIYAADIVLPGMLTGKVLRSPFPHAKIVKIDTSRAARLPGSTRSSPLVTCPTAGWAGCSRMSRYWPGTECCLWGKR